MHRASYYQVVSMVYGPKVKPQMDQMAAIKIMIKTDWTVVNCFGIMSKSTLDVNESNIY